jgi:hypothetical protein
MPGASEVPGARPLLLVDEHEAGYVQSAAWVEVTSRTRTPQDAVEVVESEYPTEDRDEEEVYQATGAQVWLRPSDVERWATDHEGEWEHCEADAPGARCFWAVVVVCLA